MFVGLWCGIAAAILCRMVGNSVCQSLFWLVWLCIYDAGSAAAATAHATCPDMLNEAAMHIHVVHQSDTKKLIKYLHVSISLEFLTGCFSSKLTIIMIQT